MECRSRPSSGTRPASTLLLATRYFFQTFSKQFMKKHKNVSKYWSKVSFCVKISIFCSKQNGTVKLLELSDSLSQPQFNEKQAITEKLMKENKTWTLIQLLIHGQMFTIFCSKSSKSHRFHTFLQIKFNFLIDNY